MPENYTVFNLFLICLNLYRHREITRLKGCPQQCQLSENYFEERASGSTFGGGEVRNT